MKPDKLSPKTIIFAVTLGLASLMAHAHAVSITWFKVAGGGGTSTSARFFLRGTIGQPDAGVLNGARFSVVGGYWALPTAVQSAGAPLLSIEQVAGGARVFWPLPATGFVLDESMTLAPTPPETIWSLVPPASYETNATHISVTVPSAANAKYYRLRRL